MHANITPDLVFILKGQTKMQQELADLKKRSADEMEALRQENSKLRRRLRLTLPRKEKARNRQKPPGPMPTNLTRRKGNITPPCILSPPLNKHLSSLLTTQTSIIQLPSPDTPQQLTLLPPFPPPISLLVTSPLLFLPSFVIPHHHTRYHHNHLNIAIPSLASSPTHLSPPNGNCNIPTGYYGCK